VNVITGFPWEPLKHCVQRLDSNRPARLLEVMPGGASTRSFVRVHFESGASAVAMYFPEAMKSDELAKPDGAVDRWPFLQVHALLTACNVAVPKILAEDCEQGLLLVEDLGEDTLANYLDRAPEARGELYQVAVRDLARAQIAFDANPGDSIVTRRAFDYDLLRWEVDHFRQLALEAQGVQLSAAEVDVFETAATYIAREAASWPRAFVHRDYQSRNLMVRREPDSSLKLYWIDFQDALLGPRVYDLVALLSDSYQTFTSEFIDDRLLDYLNHRGRSRSEFEQIRFEFDWVTVQRKLKDAGRFVFIDRVKGNSSFLRFVLPTISKVSVALENLRSDPVMGALADCLERWFEKLKNSA
jgi:aminoglycoside/choline kinase family phosphotransferase